MADLEPVQIKVKIDVEDAERGVRGLGGDARGAEGPKGERARQEQERAERARRPSHVRTAGVAAGAAVATRGAGRSRVAGALGTAARAAVSGITLSVVADMLPGMIDERLKSMEGDSSIQRFIVEIINDTVGDTFRAIGDRLRELEATAAQISAFTGAAVDTARSAQLLGTLGGAADPVEVARISAKVASAQRAIRVEQRRIGREALGGSIVNLVDQAIAGTNQ